MAEPEGQNREEGDISRRTSVILVVTGFHGTPFDRLVTAMDEHRSRPGPVPGKSRREGK